MDVHFMRMVAMSFFISFIVNTQAIFQLEVHKASVRKSADTETRASSRLQPVDADPNLPTCNDDFPNVHFIHRDRSEPAPYESVYITRAGGYYHQLRSFFMEGKVLLRDAKQFQGGAIRIYVLGHPYVCAI